jgi:hypothetical protein
MNWNTYALDRFGKRRIRKVQRISQGTGFHAPVLLAIGLRETWLENIVSYDGSDRGVFQISSEYHGEWLKGTLGCASGSYVPIYSNAYERGRVPTLRAGTHKAISILNHDFKYGKQNGVREADLLRFAVAAYNAGAGGALSGYRLGDVDAYTTGGDYSRDVLDRRQVVIRYLRRRGW